MNFGNTDTRILAYIAMVIISLGIFQARVGMDRVHPQNDKWLLAQNSDRIADYLCWRYYAKEDLGALPDTTGYSYPQKISPVYTNMIPLLAYPSKWTGIAQNEPFQYYGMWYLLCFVLQGVFALYFLYSLGVRSPIHAVAGACFFLLNITFLMKLDHPALLHQWTVIAGVIPFFRSWSSGRNLIWYAGLSVVAATTHPYMLLFAWGLPIIYALQQVVSSGFLRWDYWAIPAASITLSLLLLWLMGAFAFSTSVASSGGFGYYSANLNTFYNNLGWTNAPLHFDTYYAGAYEGKAYFGLGVLLLIPAIITLLPGVQGELFRPWSRKWIALTLGVLAFTFFAFSDVWTFHNSILITWPDFGLERFFNVFRASGRYIWLIFYLSLGLIILYWTKLPFSGRWKSLLLVGALSIQVWDMRPLMNDGLQGDSIIRDYTEAEWEELIRDFEILILYPPFKRDYAMGDDASAFVYLSSLNDQEVTSGHLPRPDIETQRAFKHQIDEYLEGNARPGLQAQFDASLFITTREYYPYFEESLTSGRLIVRRKGPYLLYLSAIYADIQSDKINRLTEPFDPGSIISIREWMHARRDGSFVIVAQDECTHNAGQEFREWMEQRGSRFEAVEFREAYYARFEKDSLLFEQGHAAVVDDTFTMDGRRWVVHSEGNAAGNDSYVEIDGQRYSDLSRGLNIFYRPPGKNEIVHAQFDTYVSEILEKEHRFKLPVREQ